VNAPHRTRQNVGRTCRQSRANPLYLLRRRHFGVVYVNELQRASIPLKITMSVVRVTNSTTSISASNIGVPTGPVGPGPKLVIKT